MFPDDESLEIFIDTDPGWRVWAERLRKWVKGTS